MECIAHVRGGKVCCVTLNGTAGVRAMRDLSLEWFPRLSVH